MLLLEAKTVTLTEEVELRMIKTIKARYHRGRLEPLEPLDLGEGDEVVVTIRHSTR